MIKVNIRQAKTHLYKYLSKLKNTPIAEIHAISQPLTKPRPLGLAKDELDIPASFFEPLSDEFLKYFSSGKK